MKKLLIICLFIQISAVSFAQKATVAQKRAVEGKVISTDGEALFGLTVLVEGTNVATTSDEFGKFKINALPKDVLIFSYIGFVTQKVPVGNKGFLNITMAIEQGSLDEVIIVGYGKTKRITNTGAVSAIKGEEIKYVPTGSVQNTLAGRLPGFFSQQRSGQPGRDASDFYIRGVSSLNGEGNRPLIIVDDVEYNYDQLQQINVNEIENVSILKDASTTAVYGIKGANGVLVIKTRRGSTGKAKVNVRYEEGVQTPVRTPNFLNSYQTATLVNEANRNDGLTPTFTDNDLALFKSGADPYGHPDVNWYKETFNKFASQHNFNVDVSGGTDKLKYFLTGGVFSQDGLVKDFSIENSDINSNYFYKRFNFRANVDYKATETLSFRFDMSSRFGNINQPHNANIVSEIYDFSKIRPYSSPFLNPNGSFSYAYDTQDHLATINARLANGGYDRINRTDSNILFGATQDFGKLVDGLSATFRLAYSSIDETNRSVIRYAFPTYRYNVLNDQYTIDPRGNYALGAYDVNGGQSVSYENLNIQTFINYNKEIDENNKIETLFLYNRQSSTSKSDVPQNFVGYTVKVNYNFKDKFILDLNGAYNGSDRFDENNRYGFFPAVGFSYVLSKEEAFKNKFSQVQLLKLRTSYGLVGSDATSGNRYLYEQVYNNRDNGYYFGDAGVPTISEGNLGNQNVTWEKSKKFDIGLDMNLFQNKLSFTVDYFYDYRYDQLVTREDVSDILGIGISPNNLAKTSNTGFDGQITYQDKITDDLRFNTNFVFSYAKNKVIYKAEAEKAYPYLQETGHPIGQPFGYTYIGFYSPEDIANNNDSNPDNNVAVPLSDVPIQAGDLKYKDLNNDGIINNFDRGAIGKPNIPSVVLGYSLGLSYKGFTAQVLFQGSMDYSFSVLGTGIEPFKSQFQPEHLNRWTPETANTASFPRLTNNFTTVNSPSAYMSDFWLVDAWYVRLKSASISYQFPERWLAFGINNARIYANGYNLFTWTSYDKYQQDPEISSNTSGDSYLTQKVFNLGIQIGF